MTRNGCNEYALGTAAQRLNLSDWISRLRVDHSRRTHIAGERQLVVRYVDSYHFESHCLCVLHGNMAEPADPRDHDRVARLGIGFLQPLVDCYSSTKDRGGRVPIETVG